MAPRKTVVAVTPTPVAPVGPVAPGSFTRTVAPFIPLAIPLLVGHSLLSSSRPTGTPTAVPQPSVQVAAPAITQSVQTTVHSSGETENAPTPLLSNGNPVDWFFVFKFNTASFLNVPAAISAPAFSAAPSKITANSASNSPTPATPTQLCRTAVFA